jgi:hypothetical protein
LLPTERFQFEQQGNDCLNSNKGEMKAASSRRDSWKEVAVDLARGDHIIALFIIVFW